MFFMNCFPQKHKLQAFQTVDTIPAKDRNY